MLLIFVDETGDSKFKDYFGVSVATINYTKYSKVKTEFQNILRKSKWDESIEFKGSYLFSATSGDINVTIEKRISIAEQIINLNLSKSNARINFYYLRHAAKAQNHGREYIKLVPLLLRKAIPKAPSGAGKKLVSIVFDYRNDIDIIKLRKAVIPVLEAKKYVVFEDPVMLNSNFNTVGILYADIIGYLAARVDTISNDAELFEGISADKFINNGKIKKLRSSIDLISKIKNIEKYEVKVTPE